MAASELDLLEESTWQELQEREGTNFDTHARLSVRLWAEISLSYPGFLYQNFTERYVASIDNKNGDKIVVGIRPYPFGLGDSKVMLTTILENLANENNADYRVLPNMTTASPASALRNELPERIEPFTVVFFRERGK